MTSPKAGGTQLGRGLSALLGERPVDLHEQNIDGGKNTAKPGLSMVPIEFLVPSLLQPRKNFVQEELESLADSIKERGILQPILVRNSREGVGEYEIIAGERRWRGAQLAGIHEVPVIIKNLPDEEVLQVALIENIQRADLNPLEEALGYRQLIDEFEHTQESLSRILGKSRSHIANLLRLLSLSNSIKDHLKNGNITVGHARTLIGVENAADIVNKIIRDQLNVRQVEDLVKSQKRPTQKKSDPQNHKDSDTLALERSLSDSLGLAVAIGFDGSGGKVTIKYDSLDQLDNIIHRLTKENPPKF